MSVYDRVRFASARILTVEVLRITLSGLTFVRFLFNV